MCILVQKLCLTDSNPPKHSTTAPHPLWFLLCICSPYLASCARLWWHCDKEMLDQLNFLFRLSFLLPATRLPSPFVSVSHFVPVSARKCRFMERPSRWWPQSSPNKWFVQRLETQKTQKGALMTSWTDHQVYVCVRRGRERERKRISLEVFSTFLDKGCQSYAFPWQYRTGPSLIIKPWNGFLEVLNS